MGRNQSTGFMEDYTYELAAGQESILQSHMLEVDPSLASNKPKIIVSPLGIGDREDPAFEQAVERCSFPISFTGKAISLRHQTLDGKTRKLFHSI